MNETTIPATVSPHMRQDTLAIRDQLRATEALSDELLFNSFELGKRMLTARRNPQVAPHIGQAALMRLVRAQQSMVEGANDLFRVHDEMNKVGIAVGVMDEAGTTPMYEPSAKASEPEVA